MMACILLLGCGAAFAATGKAEADSIASKKAVDSIINKAVKETFTNPEAARKMAGQSLILSKKINYQLGIGHSFFRIGMTYWVQSFVPVSQFYMLLAMPYLKGDKVSLAICYRCMGRNYVDLQQYPQAIQYFNKGFQLVKQSPRGKAEMYAEVSALYSSTRSFDTCLRYVDTALAYSRQLHYNSLIGILYSRMGQVYIEQKKLDLADKWLDSCLNLCSKLNNKRLQAITLLDKSRVYLMRKQYAQALDCAERGYRLADILGSIRFKIRALALQANISEAQGDIKNAYNLEKQVIAMRKVMDRESGQKSIQLVTEYSIINQKLNDIESLNRVNTVNESRIKSQHRTIALLVVLLITAVVTLLITFFYYREKRNLNNKLKEQHQSLADQTQLIEAQRADLEDVNKIKNKLLAIIGHDLRTPIANLNSITSLFADGHITQDELSKLMIDIIPIIRGAELTLANLTDFAQNQIKGKKINRSQVDMCQVVNETEEIFKHQLKKKNISFINDCLTGCYALADANHIKVVMRNLISNSIKFTDNKGRIKISYAVVRDMLEICVEDNGVGMSQEQAAKLFTGNEHISQKGTMGESGTGLGLMLCKELIGLNGGKLWMETHQGEGCRFTFSLPVASPVVS